VRLAHRILRQAQSGLKSPTTYRPGSKEDIMQRRFYIIAIVILALTAAVAVPRASAEPLTIMAIAGVVTVLSVSSVDMVARSDDDHQNKDMRAQQEENATAQSVAEAETQTLVAAAPKTASP
jgi:hypothetical protein